MTHRYAATAVTLLLGLVALYLLFGAWSTVSRCVELPNGLLIGRSAVIDPSKPYWKPGVILKYPDGRAVLPGDVFPFLYSKTSVFGIAEAKSPSARNVELDERQRYRFVYRADTGLVLKDRDPNRYDELINEAGPPIHQKRIGKEHVNIGLNAVYSELIERSDYRRPICPLSLLPAPFDWQTAGGQEERAQ